MTKFNFIVTAMLLFALVSSCQSPVGSPPSRANSGSLLLSRSVETGSGRALFGKYYVGQAEDLVTHQILASPFQYTDTDYSFSNDYNAPIETHFEFIDTAEQRDSITKISAKSTFGTTFGPFSGSASASVDLTSSFKLDTHSVLVAAKRIKPIGTFSIANKLFSPGSIANPFDPALFKYLYGTHFRVSATIAPYMLFLYKFDFSDISSTEDSMVRADIQASVGSIFSAGGSLNLSNSTKNRMSTTKIQKLVLVNLPGASFIFAAPENYLEYKAIEDQFNAYVADETHLKDFTPSEIVYKPYTDVYGMPSSFTTIVLNSENLAQWSTSWLRLRGEVLSVKEQSLDPSLILQCSVAITEIDTEYSKIQKWDVSSKAPVANSYSTIFSQWYTELSKRTNAFGSYTRTLTSWTQPETGWGPYSLKVADVNGDGKSDLIWNSLQTQNTTYVALSNGDGSFRRALTAWIQPETGWGPYSLKVADVNGDGKSDLVWNSVQNQNTTYVALSNGDGTFRRALTSWIQPETGWDAGWAVTVADVNGDTKADLVWNKCSSGLNRTYVALSNGDGTFRRVPGYWDQVETGWDLGWSLTVSDLNGDKKADLIWNKCSSGLNRTYVALSNGDGTFRRIPSYWDQAETGWDLGWVLTVADVDGDARTDLVWNKCSSSVNRTYVALSNGDGTFRRIPGYLDQPETGWGSYTLKVADADGDGKADLIWNSLQTQNTTYMALSNGDGTFRRVLTSWVQPETGWTPYTLTVSDITGDGKADLVWNSLQTQNATYGSKYVPAY